MKYPADIQIINPSDSMDEWNEFVAHSPQGSIFCQSWWLDTVCPDQYYIMLRRQDNRIIAGMPVHYSRGWGFDAIHMPPFTQTLGVLFPPPANDNYEKNLSSEMENLKVLVKAIPKVTVFNQAFHYSFTNWLPFYWAGYRQTTYYSYVLTNLNDTNKIYQGFAYSKRKNLKKANGLVEVKEDLPPDEFYKNHELTLRKQGTHISYSSTLFHRIYNVTQQHNASKIWYAIDKAGQIHSAIFIVFDSKSAFFVISSIDPDFRNSGATSLLVFRAIEYLKSYTNRFDFEGSMIEGVESSFRHFGAKQVPYFVINKASYIVESLLACRQYYIKKVKKTHS